MKTLNDLQALIDTNRHALNIKAQQAEVWAENGVLKPGTGKETETGYHVLSYQYRVAIAVEKMSAEKAPLLCVLINNFVANLDPEYNKNTIEPAFEITKLSSNSVDVEFTFEVTDPQFLTPDQESIIEINGIKMAPGSHSINVAETAKVTGAIK